MDTVDRIFELLDGTTMEQQEFAALVGVSDDTASNWRRRKSGSYAKYLPRIAEVLNTTVEYLHYGTKIQMVIDQQTSSGLLRAEKLTPEQRAAVQVMIDTLAAQNVSDQDTK